MTKKFRPKETKYHEVIGYPNESEKNEKTDSTDSYKSSSKPTQKKKTGDINNTKYIHEKKLKKFLVICVQLSSTNPTNTDHKIFLYYVLKDVS